jgi:hypothetical protein
MIVEDSLVEYMIKKSFVRITETDSSAEFQLHEMKGISTSYVYEVEGSVMKAVAMYVAQQRRLSPSQAASPSSPPKVS